MNHCVTIIALLSCLAFTTHAAPPNATVTTAFTPDCGRLLVENLREARQEIKVAIYNFTRKEVADTLIDRAEHNVKVSVKVDAQEAEYEYTQELLKRMEKAKIKVERIKLAGGVKMHNKFAVIDGKCVVTGSYNWTKRATEENYENLVAIDSTKIAKQYLAAWELITSKP